MAPEVTEEDTGIHQLYPHIPKNDDGTQRKYDESPNFEVDVVAIHGMGAHPYRTWTKERVEGDTSRYVNWLEESDMLPAIMPKARIMTYGYLSAWFGPSASMLSPAEAAQDLVDALEPVRTNCKDRPLIFIVHSFGGLVILKAIVEANSEQTYWPGGLSSLRGLVFFGTPFRGADGMTQAEMVMAAAHEYLPEQILGETLHALEPGNALLQELRDKFFRVWSRMTQTHVVCFYERQVSNVGAIVGGEDRTRYVVPQSSASLDLSERVQKSGLARTHFNMQRFAQPTETEYLKVERQLRELYRKVIPPQDLDIHFNLPNGLTTEFEKALRRTLESNERIDNINQVPVANCSKCRASIMYGEHFHRCMECFAYLCRTCHQSRTHRGPFIRLLAMPLPVEEEMNAMIACKICKTGIRARIESSSPELASQGMAICFACFKNLQVAEVRKWFSDLRSTDHREFRLLAARYMFKKPIHDRPCSCLDSYTVIGHCDRCNSAKAQLGSLLVIS